MSVCPGTSQKFFHDPVMTEYIIKKSLNRYDRKNGQGSVKRSGIDMSRTMRMGRPVGPTGMQTFPLNCSIKAHGPK